MIIFCAVTLIAFCIVLVLYIQELKYNYFSLGEAMALLSNGYKVEVQNGNTRIYKGKHSRIYYGLTVYNKLSKCNLLPKTNKE